MTVRRYLLSAVVLTLPAVVRAGDVEFNRDIRPILSDNCYACHGPDRNARKADLRLDTEAGATADRGGYQPLVPGKPDESELYRRITAADDKERMPPAKFGKKLTPRQIELVRQWIAQGGKWQKHWSLIVPKRPALPAVATGDAGWVRNPVDDFVLARLEQEGLKPAPEADRRTLLRRLSFDLTGLPPTPEEVDRFLADRRPDAYEQLVERLLGSAAYGERMAMYWLDLVRYADTGGYHSDNHRDVWPYRDYVIRAFNNNLPFDRFTTEQLAGDLLPNRTTDQLIASGYNRLLMTTEEGGAQPKEYTAKYAADRVRNASGVWLGLTMGCSECHDHKFDPVLTKEFYRFSAFFADVQEKAVGRQDQTLLSTPEQKAELARLDEEIAALRKALGGKPAADDPRQRELDGLKRHKDELTQHIPSTLVTMATPPRVVRVLPRGNWLDDSGEIVTPGVPAALGVIPIRERRATRLDLARWLTSAENPLVARVFVNRLWKLTFGQGIVKTLDDFGSQGASPTHPELLDWLAVEFRESGWDVKHMLRLLVTSSTYRQTSAASEELRQRDPYNQLLARQARFRLDAEMVHDNALAVSGLLARHVGGPSARPYQPAGYWALLNFPTREWHNDHGEGLYRRGLYTYWCRTFPHPSFVAFDAPSREECTVERPRSNTPLQALVLLNDPIYVEAARALAERIVRQRDGADLRQRIQFAYRQVLARPATGPEEELVRSLYRKHHAQYAADARAAQAVLRVGEHAPPPADAAELAAWTSVARVLLNLHETVTRN